MKHTILLVVTMIILSCDHPAYHDFYILNKADQSIVIEMVDSKFLKSSITVKPNSKELIYQGETINEVDDNEITYFITKIDIYKEGKKNCIDPLDYKHWKFEKYSKYQATSILSIQTTDFDCK